MSPPFKHDLIQEPGVNNTTFRVLLDEQGQVTQANLMTKEQIQNTWSVGNKHNQFPAIKVKFPLIAGAHQKYFAWKQEVNRPKESDYRDLIECLSHLYMNSIKTIKEWPQYRQAILQRQQTLIDNGLCKEVLELFDRYRKNGNGIEILDQVARLLVISALQAADMDSLKAICALLFGEKLKKKSGEVEDGKRITLLLDCFPGHDADQYSSSREYVRDLSRALFAAEDKMTQRENSNGLCALSGIPDQLLSGNFPEEKLPVVGPTILFAKNEGTSGATVERYGRSRNEAFPVSRQLCRKLAAGINYLCSEKFSGKTWSKLSGAGLLIAYCRSDLNIPIPVLITGELEDFDDYLDATESVLLSFKGKDLILDAAVDFIEIIKVDTANRKINFSTTASVQQLIKAVEHWQKACRNTPEFKLYAPMRTKKNKMCSPWAISPQQVMTLTRYLYIRNGDQFTNVVGIPFADVMKLFLGKHRSDWSTRLLRHITEQFQPLIQRCSLSKVQNVLPAKLVRIKTNPKGNAQALSAVTLITLLMYNTGRTKETYMEDFAFQLGQLCSAMDELHIGYCMSERKGGIPNVLLGNQVYGMALNDPIKAMSFMASRRRPYDTWAKRMWFKQDKQKDKAISNALFAQKWMKEQAEKLNLHLQEARSLATDSYKAELMLGYLAGRPFENKNTGKNTD